MERRQFTREFKLEAVRLTKQRGVSYAQASKDLGVHSPRSVGFLFSFATPTIPHPAKIVGINRYNWQLETPTLWGS